MGSIAWLESMRQAFQALIGHGAIVIRVLRG
jgi:hypothetical protein